ncbi:hypothetical protein GCD22_02028 [Acidithiobacillus thiooxidans ATCC 19377]|uniref:Uncharacterized protein n=2 Tax=Acidithiobacillus thiooxidans TaxID=930 RepID=A0A5P9XRL8_ACITH|nr:hypothetical protein GCD22_02028 [Acidithiobacillus thiooxidans ATCC 19377]
MWAPRFVGVTAFRLCLVHQHYSGAGSALEVVKENTRFPENVVSESILVNQKLPIRGRTKARARIIFLIKTYYYQNVSFLMGAAQAPKSILWNHSYYHG